MARHTASHGMRIFMVIWIGQVVSAIGTGLGSFALGVWIYERTGSVTLFAMMAFLAAVTNLALSPLAGVVADRFDRRRVMIMADTGSAVMTLLMAYGLFSGQFQVWHAYVVAVAMTAFGAFQGPALVAAVSTLVPRRDLARASGMAQIGRNLARIVGPIAAGLLVVSIGYAGVILIDFVTFLVGAGVLLFVRIPRPPVSEEGARRRSLLQNVVFGWTYIRRRTGLLYLLLLFAATNFALGMVQVLVTPLILSFASPAELGSVQSAGALGALLGAVLLSTWGGPRRRVWGIFWFLLLEAAVLFLGGARPSVGLVAWAACLAMFAGPFVSGLSQAIWQSKVALDVQGRVFAIRQMVALSTAPVAFLLAGPLADRFFEPLLDLSGPLADTIVGRVIGVGPGRGVGLMLVVLGVFMVLVTLLSYLNPRLRQVESELPDALRTEVAEGGMAAEPQAHTA